MDNGNELSEIERLKLENFALKQHVMQTQLQQVNAERIAFTRQLEIDHPGYSWVEGQGLLKVDDLQPEVTSDAK